MEHVAIMKKSWGLTAKILEKHKTIESRWHMNRSAPWNKIRAGETIYFKDSGAPITLTARVGRVMQFSDITPLRVKKILRRYGTADGIDSRSMGAFYNRFKNKKYCILIFLKSPRSITPFAIVKRGFGLMSAWVSVPHISQIKKKV